VEQNGQNISSFKAFKPNKSFFYLLSFGVFTFTLPIDKLIGVNSVALLLLSVTWLADTTWKTKWQNIRKEPYIIILVVWMLWMSVGILYTSAENRNWGWSILQRMLPMMAVPLIVLSTHPIHQVWQHRFFTIFLATLSGVLMFALGKATWIFLQTQKSSVFYNEELAGFVRISGIYLAGLTATAMFLMTEYFIPRLPKKKQLYGWLWWAIFASVLLMLNIRMAIGGVLIAYSVILIWKMGWKGIAISGVGIVVVVSLVWMNATLRTKFQEAISFNEKIILKDTQDHSLGREWGGRALRFAIWECGWDVVQENKWLGVGIGDAQTELTKSYFKNNFMFAAKYNANYNAHNQFLETWIESGFVGLLLLLAIFGYLLVVAVRDKNYLLFAFTLFMFLNCMTETYLQRQKGVTLFAFVTTMLLLKQNKNISVKEER
jgi:O-antigen ligase